MRIHTSPVERLCPDFLADLSNGLYLALPYFHRYLGVRVGLRVYSLILTPIFLVLHLSSPSPSLIISSHFTVPYPLPLFSPFTSLSVCRDRLQRLSAALPVLIR